MTSLELAALLVVALGASLVFADLPWFRHRPLVDRLRPYGRHATPLGAVASGATGPGASLRQIVGPIAADLGARMSRLLGVDTDLATRLERAGDDTDAVTFRLRQLTLAVCGLAVCGAVALWLGPPPVMSIAIILIAPVLAALFPEQRLSSTAAARQQRRRGELPVVVEQLGMLLSAGYSLTAALARLGDRGTGVVANDLRRVMQRIRHGVTEQVALSEWAESTDLDAVRRLVAVLALHSTAGDLGGLISEEARAERAEAHRDLLETIERRSQLVWVPVTVATLVPGLIFLAVPFYAAMAQVTGGG